MPHKAETPSLQDPDEALSLTDRREGSWTKLDLLEMDQRFCEAVRQAHPEMIVSERRRRAA